MAAKRTAFGTYGGTLKNHTATDLAVIASKAALEAGNIKPELIDHVIFGFFSLLLFVFSKNFVNYSVIVLLVQNVTLVKLSKDKLLVPVEGILDFSYKVLLILLL